MFVPDIPEELDTAIKKEVHLARRAFSDHDVADEINSEDELNNENITIIDRKTENTIETSENDISVETMP